MSFWSRGEKDVKDFLTAVDVYMWALSSHRLNKYFPKTTLVTDIIGGEIFADLEIPFTEVKVELEDFIDPQLNWLWIAGKIKAYSIIDEPFLHVDGDAFIGAAIPKRVLESDICVQNIEEFITEGAVGYDIEWYRRVFQHGPDFVLNQLKQDKHKSYNFGVFGGNDINFIRQYTALVFDMIEANKASLLQNAHGTVMSYFLEQYMLACHTDFYHYPVTRYLDWIPRDASKKYLQKPFNHMAGVAKYRPDSINEIRGALAIENRPLLIRCQKYIELNGLKRFP